MGKFFARWRPVHVVCFAVILLVGTPSGGKKKPPAPPPPVVQFVIVTPRDVPIYSEWIGTLDGFVNAQIRAQVTGYILEQAYIEGSEVKKDDLLFQIDPRPFQAVLDQAKANLAQTKAQLVRPDLDINLYAPLPKPSPISHND